MNDQTLTLLDLLAKSTAVVLLGFGCLTSMRRRSAAYRSLAWLAVFVALMVLPLVVFVRPIWTVDVPVVKASIPLSDSAQPLTVEPTAVAMPTAVAAQPVAEAAPAWTLWQWLAAIYISGMILVIGFRVIGSFQLMRLGGQNGLKKHNGGDAEMDARIGEMVMAIQKRGGFRRRVRVLQSDRVTVPMTWGTFKPVLMLPSTCSQWSDADLRAALEHEMAHIRHGDAARRLLATFVSALWWPHPLVWLASKAWRLEQERACDDAVVRSGSDAGRYAEQLLEAARSVRLGSFQSAAALVMAMPSGLETRLRAVVGSNVNRAAAGREAFALASAAAFFVVAFCAVCQAQTAVAPQRDKRQILITTKFVEAPVGDIATRLPDLKSALDGKPTRLSDAEMQELVGQLSQKKGVDLMSTPTVTTRSGQKATIEVAREFMYPTEFEIKDGHFSPTHFEMMPVGITVELNASFENDNVIRLKPATAKVSEFLGFLVGGRENLKEVGNGKWRFDDSKAFVGRENKISGSAKAGGLGRVTDVAGKMKTTRQNDVRKGEVSKPVFSVEKWSEDVSLKQGDWMVSCLSRGSDAEAEDEKRVWFFVSASETQATERPAESAQQKASEEKSAMQRARRIIFPHVKFHEAKLSEVLDYLRVNSMELDPDKQGVDLIMKPGTPDGASITLDLKDMPLNEVLRYATELSGTKAVYEPYAVTVSAVVAGGAGDEMLTWVYAVPSTLLGTEKSAKNWLTEKGVVFPDGASAVFNPNTPQLIVRNTEGELRKVEKIVEKIVASPTSAEALRQLKSSTEKLTTTFQHLEGGVFDAKKAADLKSAMAKVQVAVDELKARAIAKNLETRARLIILPQVEFSGATIDEAVEFLQVKSRQLDPDKKGVNIVLKKSEVKNTALLTLSLKSVPLWEALHYVAELAGMTVEVGESAIAIQPADVAR